MTLGPGWRRRTIPQRGRPVFGVGLRFALRSEGSGGAGWLSVLRPVSFLHPFVTKKQGRKVSLKVVTF